jgi:hypothetical protein
VAGLLHRVHILPSHASLLRVVGGAVLGFRAGWLRDSIGIRADILALEEEKEGLLGEIIGSD